MAEIGKTIDISEALHGILTNHGITSRQPEYEKLVTELGRWAADGCRQTQDRQAEPLISQLKEIWELAHRVNSVYSDAHMSKNAKLFEMRGAASKIIDICDKIRRG